MKILIITSAGEETSVGKAILSLVKNIPSTYLVEVIIFQRENPSFNKWSFPARPNVELKYVFERTFGDLRAYRQMKELIRTFDPDIVETTGYKADILFFFLNRTERKMWISFCHGWTSENLRIKMYNRIDQWVIRKANRIIVVSENARETFLGSGFLPENVVTVPNAIEGVKSYPDNDLMAVRKEFLIPENAFVISVIGRLSHEKGQDILLLSLSDGGIADGERNQRPLVVLFVGDGPDERRLRKMTRRLGLQPSVRFCGHRSDVGKFYQISDLICLPSRSENMPYVVLEALLYGKPVLATQVGGIPEMISHEVNGLLVRPGEPDEIRSAIARLYRDPVLIRTLADNICKEKLLERFNPEMRASQICSVYDELSFIDTAFH